MESVIKPVKEKRFVVTNQELLNKAKQYGEDAFMKHPAHDRDPETVKLNITEGKIGEYVASKLFNNLEEDVDFTVNEKWDGGYDISIKISTGEIKTIDVKTTKNPKYCTINATKTLTADFIVFISYIQANEDNKGYYKVWGYLTRNDANNNNIRQKSSTKGQQYFILKNVRPIEEMFEL